VEDVDGEATAFGVDRDGDKLHSLKDPTEMAGAHEAIEIIINNHPQKEALLLAEGSGTGADKGKKKTLANSTTIAHADKDAFGSNIEKIASGEVKVIL
jgi:DNA segregation ATPase FtsK/SpoIIIE-like protein